MNDIINGIININNYLLLQGINVIAIILIIAIVHGLKVSILENLSLYNDKTKIVINIGLGLIIGFIVTILFYILKFDWNIIIRTSITSTIISVFSHQLVKGLFQIISLLKDKFFKGDKE
jgi:hypothetical protein